MTLAEYCTGIADAIREKEGSTGVIPAPDHAARIKALSSNPTVTFLNYSGSVTYTNADGVLVKGQAINDGDSIVVRKNTIFFTTPDIAAVLSENISDVRIVFENAYLSYNEYFFATGNGTMTDISG